jgi:hypothetical protein
MKLLALAVLAAASAAAGQANDTTAEFPALMTTVPEPRTDGYHTLAFCEVIDNQRRCGDDLGQAWCAKWGYAGFEKWTTAHEGDIVRCEADDSYCPTVTTITCRGVPISD